jgi:hypothetical protein
LLDDAAGYVVFGSDGRRLGTVIELVSGGEERSDSLAIRCDRIFFWKRRTVPVAAVGGLDPQRQTVTLMLDSTNIERAHELHTSELQQGWVADRIAHYADAPTPEAEASAGEGNPAVDGLQHVLFAPTAAGYLLIEREGSAPPRAGTVELSDPPGRFEVVKLAQSPLPHDQRLCAYLDRIV